MTVLDRPLELNAVADRSSETTEAGVPWLAFHRHRQPIRRRWPSIWKLPIVATPLELLRRHNVAPRALLDVGATDRVWEQPARDAWSGVEYRSLDIDRTNTHDYYDFDEVDRSFDVVTCLEVLEHVPPDVAIQLVRQCAEACALGGHLLVSVPNVLTPGVQLEFTHQTSYALMDLGGLLSWSGLEVLGAARLWMGGGRRLALHRVLLQPLHRALRVDYCQSIVMLAQRGPSFDDCTV